MSKFVRLDDIAEVVRGVTFSREVTVDMPLDGYVPVLRAGNIQEGALILKEDLVWVPENLVTAKQLLRENDLVMCTSSGSAEVVGKVAPFLSSEWVGSFGAFCAVIRPKTNKCDSSYLKHFLQSDSFLRWARQSLGANIKNIRKSEMESFELRLPPLEEQKRIAAILDKADSLRRKRAQAIALADDFLRAAFLDLFGDPVTNPKGWPVYELRDLVEIGDKINYGVVQPGDDAFDDGVPLVRSGDLCDETPDVAKLRYVSQVIDQKHRKSKLKGNEVLIACVGTIGKVGFVTEEMIGWNIARAVARIPIKSGVNREYVYRYLQSPVVQGFFQKETRTVAQPTLNIGLIETTQIALPPEQLQLEYLEKYTKIQRFLGLLKKQIEELEQLANSLSISMVTG